MPKYRKATCDVPSRFFVRRAFVRRQKAGRHGRYVACVCLECFQTPAAKVKDFLQKSKQMEEKSFCYLKIIR